MNLEEQKQALREFLKNDKDAFKAILQESRKLNFEGPTVDEYFSNNSIIISAWSTVASTYHSSVEVIENHTHNDLINVLISDYYNIDPLANLIQEPLGIIKTKLTKKGAKAPIFI